MINFTTQESQDFTLVTFSFEGALEPSILKETKPPEVNFQKGVVISGRGPVWLFAFLVHEYHPSQFVCTFDPRLGGVVVESHTPCVEVGGVIAIKQTHS